MVARSVESYFQLFEHLDLHRRAFGRFDWGADVHPHSPHPFRYVAGDDAHGRGAVSPLCCSGTAYYDRAGALYSGGSLDAPGNLAGHFQPGRVFVVSFLPRPMLAAGVWYLLTGLTCIALAGGRALSPWAMGIPYGTGQLLVAGILLFGTHEGEDES